MRDDAMDFKTEIVTQESILEVIKNNPGILQSELKKMCDPNVHEKISSMRKKGLIYREYDKTSWKIYPK